MSDEEKENKCDIQVDSSAFTNPELRKDSKHELRPIYKLSEEVVNRIAAGEVIQRPVNAIKELLENALDAGSTQIQITVLDGGLKLLQVQDNGCGIRCVDLPILCERFTTSKLREFSELSMLSTFGFRGEALASLSHVALLTVTSRTADEPCAYKMCYRNSRPVLDRAQPCAGNLGTCILAEDLFYNTPMRRNALRNPREELARVVEVVSQYAIHNAPRCGFHLRTTQSTTGCDLRTMAGWSRMDAIRAVIGASVADNLVAFNSCQSGASEATRRAIEKLGMRHEGLLTTPSQLTSGTSPALKLCLFINNRMVECTAIRRALECTYSAILSRTVCPSSPAAPVMPANRRGFSWAKVRTPGGGTSRAPPNAAIFVYLNLQLPERTVDVNVHPAKTEVLFLHEEDVIAGLQDAVEHSLLSQAQTRSFPVNVLYSQNTSRATHSNIPASALNASQYSTSSQSPLYKPAKEKIRVDSRERRLEPFLVTVSRTPTAERRLTALTPDHTTDGNVEHGTDGPSQAGPPSRTQSPDLQGADENGEQNEKGRRLTDCGITSLSSGAASGGKRCSSPTAGVTPVAEEPFPKRLSAHLCNNLLTGKPICRQSSSGSTDLPSPPSMIQLKSDISTARASASRPAGQRRAVHLTSVLTMQRNLLNSASPDGVGRRFLRNCKFVGHLDPGLCLVQHETDLLLVQLRPLATALFYQLLVANFANYGELILSEPVSVRHLLLLPPQSSTSSTFVDQGIALLTRHAPMLWDYFSFRLEAVNEGGTPDLQLHSLPLLLNRYSPDLGRLPAYLTDLIARVNWSDETSCFEGICRLTADFYSTGPAMVPYPNDDGDETPANGGTLVSLQLASTWVTEHVLWPALTACLLPLTGLPLLPRSLTTAGVCQQQQEAGGREGETRSSSSPFIRLVGLSDLYKVFERC